MDEEAKPALVTATPGMIQRLLPALVAIAIVLCTTPLFFSYYREAAFHSAPFDDYAPSLLALVGERGNDRLDFPGQPPARIPTVLQESPMGYRILSVAAGIPFYYALPYYQFSNLENPDEHYLRAVEAMMMVSYLSVLLSVLVTYLIARRRLRASQAASLLTALVVFGLFEFLGTLGVDALAVLIICVLVYFLDRPAVFVPLMLVSAVTNEKVFMIFTLVFGARVLAWLFARRGRFEYWPQAIATAVAAAIYFGMRLVLRLPGWENQTDPTTWLSGASSTLRATLSLKGAIQNGTPLVVIAIVMLVAWLAYARPGSTWRFSRLDLLAAPALFVLALCINMQYTVGHLVLHTFPLYLPLLAPFVQEWVVRPSVEPEGVRSAPATADRGRLLPREGAREPEPAPVAPTASSAIRG